MSIQPITIALAKGRLAELAVELLEACGLDCQQVRHPERKLVLYDEAGEYRFVLVKPSDVPIYVERGVADIGVVGKDTLMKCWIWAMGNAGCAWPAIRASRKSA